MPIGNSPDTFNCQEEFSCAATGATCFSFDNPDVVECCDAADTCQDPDADNIFTCEGHCARIGEICYLLFSSLAAQSQQNVMQMENVMLNGSL